MKIFQKYSFILLLMITSIIIACPHEKDQIIEIETQGGLKNLLTKSQAPIIIVFHMKHCGWCIKMEPIIKEIANDPQFKDICFYRADGRDLQPCKGQPSIAIPDLVKQETGLDLPGYPFILFMNHGKVIDSQIGGTVLTKEQKNQGLTESDVLADKIKAMYPHAINNNQNQNDYCCY